MNVLEWSSNCVAYGASRTALLRAVQLERLCQNLDQRDVPTGEQCGSADLGLHRWRVRRSQADECLSRTWYSGNEANGPLRVLSCVPYNAEYFADGLVRFVAMRMFDLANIVRAEK